MASEKSLEPNKAVISRKLREWAENYHTGYFVLRGDNPLVKNSRWTRLQRFLSKEGSGVIVRKDGAKGAEDLFLIGVLQDVEHDDVLEENGTSYKNANVSYITRSGDEDLINENEPEDFVVAGNNDRWTADLQFNTKGHD